MSDQQTYTAQIHSIKGDALDNYIYQDVHGVFFVNPGSYGDAEELFEKGAASVESGDRMLFVNTQAIVSCLVVPN